MSYSFCLDVSSDAKAMQDHMQIICKGTTKLIAKLPMLWVNRNNRLAIKAFGVRIE
jgi:hypothetical protein